MCVCVKGLTQLHVGGRIPVVTVQNPGAKAMMEHFFLFYSFLLWSFISVKEGGQQQQFLYAIVYLKEDRQCVFGYD